MLKMPIHAHCLICFSAGDFDPQSRSGWHLFVLRSGFMVGPRLRDYKCRSVCDLCHPG